MNKNDIDEVIELFTNPKVRMYLGGVIHLSQPFIQRIIISIHTDSMGNAYESIKTVIEFCLNTLNIKYIVSETQTRNEKSCKLLKILGYKIKEKTERFGAEQSLYLLNLDVEGQ